MSKYVSLFLKNSNKIPATRRVPATGHFDGLKSKNKLE
jgi:hypothetical protein